MKAIFLISLLCKAHYKSRWLSLKLKSKTQSVYIRHIWRSYLQQALPSFGAKGLNAISNWLTTFDWYRLLMNTTRFVTTFFLVSISSLVITGESISCCNCSIIVICCKTGISGIIFLIAISFKNLPKVRGRKQIEPTRLWRPTLDAWPCCWRRSQICCWQFVWAGSGLSLTPRVRRHTLISGPLQRRPRMMQHHWKGGKVL